MKKRFYIYKSGLLERKDNSLLFTDTDGAKNYIPIEQVEQLFICNHCSFNKEVISLLFQYEINMILLSYNGKYEGGFFPKHNRLGNVLLKQAEILNNEERLLYYRKTIIKSSLNNSLNLLKSYNKRGVDLQIEIDKISKNIQDIDNKKLEDLLLVEAQSKQIYYSCFDRIIKNKEFVFDCRGKNPPTNEVNALMSYGYGILYSIFESDIYSSNMDISLPLVHGLSKNEGGLQFDLADILKPVIVDRTIFRIINLKQITTKDFYKQNGGVYLSKEGMKIFVSEIEKTLNERIKHMNKVMSYRSVIKQEVYSLQRAIENNGMYNCYTYKW